MPAGTGRKEDNSDLTLLCNGREFKVHKAVVFAHSAVLAAPFKHNFKEAQTNAVEVNFDTDTCERMIDFMYTGQYRVDTPDNLHSGPLTRSPDKRVVLKRTNGTQYNKKEAEQNDDEEIYEYYDRQDDDDCDQYYDYEGKEKDYGFYESLLNEFKRRDAYEEARWKESEEECANDEGDLSTIPDKVSNKSSQRLLELLLAHARINGIGDYYNIPELCTLSRANIDNKLNAKGIKHILDDLIKQASSITADKGFWKMMAEVALEDSNVDAETFDMLLQQSLPDFMERKIKEHRLARAWTAA